MGLAGKNTLWSMETEHSDEETSLGKKYDEILPNHRLPDGQYLHQDRQPSVFTVHCYLWEHCAALLADLFLYSYEVEFLRFVNKSNKKLAKTSNLTPRYSDDLISINKLRFKHFLKDIYPARGARGFRDIRIEKCCLTLGFAEWHRKVTFFAQFLARDTHFIFILSIFLNYLGIFKQSQFMIHTSHS